ncbi:ATP-binding protein [Streptomyces sp. RKND-216]|uniref:ATP-binding protein n=1 Tax=Streptomyces sp. RKND-216 TaxID=2562581 RepID=UPI00109DB6DB|nr:ATP-binding protein [Streptomyces sp. RKND-216]THA25691.1 ATP-binding protein [Streptomyces sp. RKND-216]
MCPTITSTGARFTAVGADFALTFPPDPVWVRACRELVRTSFDTVRRAAGGALRELAETAVLLTSEAATNAVTASVTAGCTRPVTLCGEWLAHGALRVHVQDAAPGVPYIDTPAEESEHGRGMLLIAALASRYGFCLDGPGPGKSFWFQLEHAPGAAA